MFLVCVAGSGGIPPGRVQGTGESQTKCFLYVVGSGSVPPGRAQGTGESQTKCFLYVLQARVAFLQGERKGQENLKLSVSCMCCRLG